MIWSFSCLNEEQIKAINKLQDDLGVVILSFSSQDIKPAELTEAQSKQIKELEDQLRMSLVAFTK